MSLNAADVMTRDVVTVRPDDSVARVARVLTDHEISAVPVCDADRHVIGMLSEGDLMRPFGKENALKRSWWLNVLAEGTELAPAFLDYVRLDNRRARDLMVAPVITARHDAGLGEIVDLLAHHRIKRVPITKDGRLVGIVSRADVVRVLAERPDALMASA